MKSIKLQLKSILQVPLNKYEKDFTFIVNGERFQTSHFIADLLSPIVRKYHYEDESQEIFVINTNRHTQDEIYFPSFLELYNFSKTFQLDKTEQEHYKEYFLKVGNISEYLRLRPELFIEASSDNVIEKLDEIMEILSQANHPAIVKIYYYSPVDQKGKYKNIIVKQFLKNKTVKDHIEFEEKSISKWDITTKIII